MKMAYMIVKTAKRKTRSMEMPNSAPSVKKNESKYCQNVYLLKGPALPFLSFGYCTGLK